MTEITAINRATGKFSYYTKIPRKLTDKQVEADLKSMGVTREKHIIIITYPEK
jgi:hypothetical protein